MSLSPNSPRVYDFNFPHFDTLIRVEEMDDFVIIRATRDTFTEERKRCFVRELVAEGFIPERCHWFPSSGAQAYLGVSWVVDGSWTEDGFGQVSFARRILRRLVVGGGLAALFVGAWMLAYRF